MPDEVWDTLLRFHKEVFLPDLERIFNDQLGGAIDEIRAQLARYRESFPASDSQSGDCIATPET